MLNRFNYSRFLSAILVSNIVLLISCLPQAVDVTITPNSGGTSENIVPIITIVANGDAPLVPSSVPNGNGCFRPYTAASIWNVPIDWSRTRIHPKSDAMLASFFQGESWIGSNTDSYAPNLYFVRDSTSLVPVTLRYRFQNVVDDIDIEYGIPGHITLIPLPPDAQPASGSDGQLVVVNLESGEEWGLSKARIDGQGLWAADGGYRYSINFSGIPPKGFGQRGAGIGHLAGLVRPCEVERGYIDHAVTLAYDYPCEPENCQINGWPDVIRPFTKTDGLGLMPYDIPEGARIVIRPEVTRAEITGVCSNVRGCIVWALAMQKYGGFIVDDSGHPKTYAEGSKTANWNSEIWFSDMLKNIPPEWYAVIDWN